MRQISFAVVLLLFTHFCFAQDDTSIQIGKVIISGEGGLVLFHSGEEGEYPNSEFRVDEAKLFVEAALGGEIYVFSELNLTSREEGPEVEIGELYVEFADLLRFWNREGLLNVRFGRLDVPFGEEYLTRDAIDNPLISHSITDFWAVDEGVEVFGSAKQFSYIVAVQNGGNDMIHDFNSDKSVAGHITYDFPKWLHLSFSAMRTGDLDVRKDILSALWINNGLFRSLGSPLTTIFNANLYLIEGQVHWPGGHFRAGAGRARYDDDDLERSNRRDVPYYQLEAVQNVTKGPKNQLYGGIRFGEMTSDEGFPMVGHARFGPYLFNNENLTTRLWRLSLGVGYRPNENVLLKTEYTFERGDELNGYTRDQEDFFGFEVALKF